MQYDFPEDLFISVIGGQSILDIPRLRIFDKEEAYNFIYTYGYNLKNDKDLAEVNRIYSKALQFFRNDLLDEGEAIPPHFTELQTAEDYYNLLITASSKEKSDEQLWACAILRSIHVVNHLRNGLFRTFSEKIQDQIFGLFYGHIHKDEDDQYYLGNENTTIPLQDFEIKRYKSRSSAAIKLLAKRNEFAMNILDRMGVRFVTHTLYDTFQVLNYLISSHLISVPNITPDQSKNTLFPLDIFFDVMDKLSLQDRHHTREEIDALLLRTFEGAKEKQLGFNFKPNDFSSGDYRAIKFIARHMVNIPIGKKNLRFFFPYEVQIIDKKTAKINQTGASAHLEYKERQRQSARDRVFGKDL